MKLLVATLAATLFAGASAIYPGDHWQFATKLNNGIVDSASYPSCWMSDGPPADPFPHRLCHPHPLSLE